MPKWETKPLPELDHLNVEGRFQIWCKGETGFPFIDASMKELAATGYMSNRSRQNVASLLTKVRCGTVVSVDRTRKLPDYVMK